MERSGDAALWAANFEGYDPAVAFRDGRWLLYLCVGWLALLLLTLEPAVTRDRAELAPAASVGRPAKAHVAPPLPIALAEPSAPLALSPDEARVFNASVPFVAGPITAAKKFVYTGTAADRERALTCLAGVAWYEAGDDKVGQQAVVQVVLNRLRHPAFPKTICGVVFEGAGRRTGCQFTFTCDGALRRVPETEAWQRARAIARRAMSGFVFKTVGNATHYHTDWVVPYWSDTLDKLAEVHTHLFYRWRGAWGTAAAFTRRVGGPEDLDPRLAHLADPAVIAASAALAAPTAIAPPQAPDGRKAPLATIAPAAPAAVATVLPMAPAAARHVPPRVAQPSIPTIDPATIRFTLAPAGRPRAVMTFNRPGDGNTLDSRSPPLAGGRSAAR